MFETRQVHESLVYCLALNSIFANAEQGSIVAAATSEDALRAFYEGELLAEPERDGRWVYSFRDGPLRHYNPLHRWHHVSENEMGWNQGWFAEWVEDPHNAPDGCHAVDF